MSYTLDEIRLAAYHQRPLEGMNRAERDLYQGLGFAYEEYRCGQNKEICDDLAQNYIRTFKNRKGRMLEG